MKRMLITSILLSSIACGQDIRYVGEEAVTTYEEEEVPEEFSYESYERELIEDSFSFSGCVPKISYVACTKIDFVMIRIHGCSQGGNNIQEQRDETFNRVCGKREY